MFLVKSFLTTLKFKKIKIKNIKYVEGVKRLSLHQLFLYIVKVHLESF